MELNSSFTGVSKEGGGGGGGGGQRKLTRDDFVYRKRLKTVRKKLTGGWGIFANVPLTKPCILKARIHFFFKKTLFEKTFKGFVTFRRHGK